MNKQEVHKRAINKAKTQISFIKLEMSALENEKPYMSFTQEMIEGQQAFKCKELDTWTMILKALEWQEKTRYVKPKTARQLQ